MHWLRRVLIAVAALYALIVAAVLIAGPWRLDVGFMQVSASAIDKPLLVAIFAAVGAVLLSLGAHASPRHGSPLAFYLCAAIATWLLALGPTLTLMGEASGRAGPFVLLQALPGVDGLRVPARFWLMSVICLTTAAGIFIGEMLRGRRGPHAAVPVVLISCALLGDGWIGGIPSQPVPGAVPDAAILRGGIVLQLPLDPYPDIAATWRAVTGGWRSVNGYSGYAPNYYASLARAAQSGDPAMFDPFRRAHDLHVVVADDAASLKEAVETQPGAVRVAQRSGSTQYRLPRQEAPPVSRSGSVLTIAAARSPCSPDTSARIADDDEGSLWECRGSPDTHEITIDLGGDMPVGAVEYSLGRSSWNVPSQLVIETSVDGAAWSEARRGSVLGELIEGGLRDPASLRAVLPFSPRLARYVRIRPIAEPEDFVWFVAELDVRAAP
jgi:hypothetical protein